MKIGIAGLGLIGGSMAKAIKTYTGHEVYGFDKDATVLDAACSEGSIDGALSKENIGECRLLLLALYPKHAVDYVREMGGFLGKDSIVMDLCGVKEAVTEPLTALAEQYGFSYIGAHPMAGTEKTGYANSFAALFQSASMILVPEKAEDEDIALVTELSEELGFSKVVHASARDHDRIIAYTSQLAHVVSNAFVKSPTALLHHGFSAGSYKDLTRVAWLNEVMWTELFLDNREALADEIAFIREALLQYETAIRQGAREELMTLLKEGRERKERIDRQ